MAIETEVQNNTKAIASLNQATADLKARADRIEDKVPEDASQTNKLADKQWVLSTARQVAEAEAAKIVDGATGAYDTLKEIASYIESDKTGAAQMAASIAENKATIEELRGRTPVVSPCIIERTEGRVEVRPVADSIFGAFFSDEEINSEGVYNYTWKGMVDLTVDVWEEGYFDLPDKQYESVSFVASLEERQNCTVEFDGVWKITITKDLLLTHNTYGVYGTLKAGSVLNTRPDMSIDPPSAQDNYIYLPDTVPVDISSQRCDREGWEIGEYLWNSGTMSKQTEVVIPQAEVVVCYPSNPEALRDDVTFSLKSSNADETDVTWENLFASLVEKFPGASRMAPGANIWNLTRVSSGDILIDRVPGAGGAATGDSGNA